MIFQCSRRSRSRSSGQCGTWHQRGLRFSFRRRSQALELCEAKPWKAQGGTEEQYEPETCGPGVDLAEEDFLAQHVAEFRALAPNEDGWVTDVGEDREFAVKLQDGQVSLWSSSRYRGMGSSAIVSAVAALVEMQLCPEHKPNMLKVEPLASGSHSAVFRIWQNGAISRSLEDNISVVRLRDDLDIGDGSIWIFMDPPAQGQDEVLGVPVPAPDSNAIRSQEARSAFRIIPSRQGDDFTLVSLTVSRPPPQAYSMLDRMPSFAIRAFMRRTGRNLTDGFERFVSGSQSLCEAIQQGPRRSWYEDFNFRIASWKDRVSASTQLTKMEGQKLAQTDELSRELHYDQELEDEFVNCFGFDFAAFSAGHTEGDGFVSKVERFCEHFATLCGASCRPEGFVDVHFSK